MIEETIFTVKWSDYWKRYIATSENEIYDISETIFNEYEIVEEGD